MVYIVVFMKMPSFSINLWTFLELINIFCPLLHKTIYISNLVTNLIDWWYTTWRSLVQRFHDVYWVSLHFPFFNFLWNILWQVERWNEQRENGTFPGPLWNHVPLGYPWGMRSLEHSVGLFSSVIFGWVIVNKAICGYSSLRKWL